MSDHSMVGVSKSSFAEWHNILLEDEIKVRKDV